MVKSYWLIILNSGWYQTRSNLGNQWFKLAFPSKSFLVKYKSVRVFLCSEG
jgi:hypothetical protein